MTGFGPRAGSGADATPQTVDLDTAASLYHQAGQEAFAAGRDSADMEIAAGILGQNDEYRAHAAADQEQAAYGPGGREHFADPRAGDFPGRRHESEREAEAG